ncbi:hypothetical protein ACS5PN_21220 [Roseateles sp. NT4]|uniref:hypothetical protein n=1 Tax=Roseateles sp. NT4 TaxID=3453715 RepID=UPI003EF0377E
MPLMLRIALLATATSALFLSGCSSPAAGKEIMGSMIGRPYTPTAEDRAQLPTDPNFKLQPASSGKAVVYVYRNSQVFASAMDYEIHIDERLAAKLANGRYVRLELEPGAHVLHAQIPQYVPDTPAAADDLNNIQRVPRAVRNLNLQPGEIYIARLNRGQKYVDTVHVSKSKDVTLLSKVFNLEPISAEEGLFDMSRLQPSDK